MANQKLNITLDADLAAHVEARTGSENGFRSADDYIGDLIRRDKDAEDLSARFLDDLLGEAAGDDEAVFLTVTADAVLRRNP